MAPHESRIGAWFHEIRLPLAICTFTGILYSRSLFCVFVRDDHSQIVQNPGIQSWDNLFQFFASPLWTHRAEAGANQLFYRPLFSSWMLLVHTAGGLEPWFWHLSSVLLHVLATYLVLQLCLRLTNSNFGAAVGATLFAVHPIHVDAVSWVSASNEILFTIGVLGALLLLLNENAQPSRIWLGAIAFGAALFSKETALAILPILVIAAWVRSEPEAKVGPWQRVWKASWPYLIVSSLYLGLRWFALRGVPIRSEHSWKEVVLSGPSILLFYLKKLVFPIGLSPAYVNTITASPKAIFWLDLGLLGIAGLVILWLLIKSRSLVGLALAALMLGLLPAAAVVRIYLAGDLTHDRYLYAPSAGLSVMAAIVAAYLWSKGKAVQWIALGITTALFLICGAATFAQQKYYYDDFAFYQRAIDVDPANAVAYSALGDLYLDRGQIDRALEYERRAHEIAPADPSVALWLSRALFVAERYDESETVLKDLLRIPNLNVEHRSSALLSLASLEIARKNMGAARALLDEAEKLDPHTPDLYWTKGVLDQREGRLAQAIAEYERDYEISGDTRAQSQAAILRKQLLRAEAAKAVNSASSSISKSVDGQ